MLQSTEVKIKESRLLKTQEVEELGCIDGSVACMGAPSFVYETSYWLGSTYGDNLIWGVASDGEFRSYNYRNVIDGRGIRPVIEIATSDLEAL